MFSPQIIENFRRGSADGLSIYFLLIWLLGDLFNILGGIFQGVLPTMLILAVYYTLADIVLLAQVLYYTGFSFRSKTSKTVVEDEVSEHVIPTEESPLIHRLPSPSLDRLSHSINQSHTHEHTISDLALRRTSSGGSYKTLLHTTIDGVHLSPATPLLEAPPAQNIRQPQSILRTTLFNIGAILVVCGAGVGGWYLAKLRSQSSTYNQVPSEYSKHNSTNNDLEFDTWGQIFGYLCAALYLGSRVPQLLLNHRRKSTEGVSMLFFLFACVGNLTYVLSIFAFEPACAKVGRGWEGKHGHVHGHGHRYDGCMAGQWSEVYARYIRINASWLVGSAGTLVLDLAVFAQFWMYQGNSPVVANCV